MMADGGSATPVEDDLATGGLTSASMMDLTAKVAAIPAIRKRAVTDFKFGDILGEGSFSTVQQAIEIATGREFAIKVLDKKHIIKEKKAKYVTIEKNVLNKLNHPFTVKLYYTFQDVGSLYFVLDYAPNGELLDWIKKLGSFDEQCTRFYAAEILTAIEYLHALEIIHRDIKPENILLDAKMHVKITDFGTAKMLNEDPTEDGRPLVRANSFVGTAEYVSPELLVDKVTTKMSDVWAWGCIIYQLLAGRPPFKGPNEYQTFQKITRLEYTIPEGFPAQAQELVKRVLVHDPAVRFGADDPTYAAIKAHPFFDGIDWETLHSQTPPKLLPYVPPTPGHEELRGDDVEPIKPPTSAAAAPAPTPASVSAEDPARESKLRAQQETSRWAHVMLENELILKTGIVWKRKGFFAKKRQLILTDFPRLIYLDDEKFKVKGEIPWSTRLKPELKNRRNFFVHTPKRTYYLEDEGDAESWVASIQAAQDVHMREKAAQQ